MRGKAKRRQVVIKRLMENIKNKILAEFVNLDVFRHTTVEPQDFDRDVYEKTVIEELQYHCKEHQYSSVLKNQLIDLHGNGFVTICGLRHPYELKDIYWTIEDTIKNQAPHKSFSRKKSYLKNKNIYHTHHSQAFYSMGNCIRYFKKMYAKDEDVWRHLRELQLKHPEIENIMPAFAYTVLIESLSWNNKKGEWIVYEKIGDRINFLCLYIHNDEDKDDQQLFSLIKEEIATT